MLTALERASTSLWVYECVLLFLFSLSLSLPDLPTGHTTIGRSSSTIKFHAEHLKVSFFVSFVLNQFRSLLFSFLCFSYYYPSTFPLFLTVWYVSIMARFFLPFQLLLTFLPLLLLLSLHIYKSIILYAHPMALALRTFCIRALRIVYGLKQKNTPFSSQ